MCSKMIFIIFSLLLVIVTANEPLCNHILCTSTQKTLVKFFSSSALLGNSSIDIRQNDIWAQAKDKFSDYKSISFAEVDCDEKPAACFNFANEKIPSYILLSDELLTAVCVQPINFNQLQAFCMELLGRKYQKKKDYFVYDDECNTIYPEIMGSKVTSENFNSSIECGHHFVLFYQPKCVHCKKIISRWNKLTILYKDLNFDFIKCEKTAERDFCATHQAIGFPTLNFYIDGKFQAEYTDGDETTEFQTFIDELMNINATCIQTLSVTKNQGDSAELLN